MKRKVISVAILVTVVLLCFVLFRSQGPLKSQKTSTLAADLHPSNSLPMAIPEISSSLQNSTARELGRMPLAVAWAAKDPEGASRWAVALPTGRDVRGRSDDSSDLGAE